MAPVKDSLHGGHSREHEEEQKLKLRQALQLVGAGALTGALLLGTAPPATADDIRDRQWALDAFGAEQIWEHSTGEGITVAVVDLGVDASHPDLEGQVLKGKDFTEEGGSAQDDTNGHGTSVASLIAGTGHGPGNESGVMGLAPDAKILPIRFAHDNMEMGSSWADGVRYAVDQGADIINISQVTSGAASSEQEAIEYAIDNDVLVVAGSGNTGTKKQSYPAAYPGVVSVGGVDKTGAIWEDSSWGSNITLVAPATENVVADSNYETGYALANGTSDATAYVSASAALVMAEHPDLTAGQVVNRLIKTAMIPEGEDSKAELPDEKFGYGAVRPFRAVTYDIPAGPKDGPLEQPAEEDPSTTSGLDDSAAPSGDSADGGGVNLLLVGGIVGIVLVGAIVVALVLAKRNKAKSQALPYYGPPGQGAPWAGVPGQHPGQQPPATNYGNAPVTPPPPPNLPPGQ